MNKPKFSPFFFTSFIFCLLFLTSATFVKDDLVEDILKYTNQFRKSKGLKNLELKDELSNIAKKHSADMASGRKSFGHGGYNQREIQVKKIIKTYSGMAENVAYGAKDGKEAFEIWKNSKGHRENMLGNYKYIGIGTARDRRGTIYYTEIFAR